MAQEKPTGVLDRLAGKSVCFRCNFAPGQVDYLHALVTAQQGKIVSELDSSVDYLVIDEQNMSETNSQLFETLAAQGSAFEILYPPQLVELLRPTEEDLCTAIRSGNVPPNSTLFRQSYYESQAGKTDNRTLVGKDLRGAKLKEATFSKIGFTNCQFNQAELNYVRFENETRDCDFSNSELKAVWFEREFSGNCFRGAQLEGYFRQGDDDLAQQASPAALQISATVQRDLDFQNAQFKRGGFFKVSLQAPNFTGAQFNEVRLTRCQLNLPSFVGAKLENVVFKDCKLSDADFSNADLTGTCFAYCEIDGANFRGANLKGVNLRGTTLNNVDLSQAKNFSPESTTMFMPGPALQELDRVEAGAERIFIELPYTSPRDALDGDKVRLNTTDLRCGRGLSTIFCGDEDLQKHTGNAISAKISDALLCMGNIGYPVIADLANVRVTSTKSPLNGKELWELVVRAIGEAFGQDVPANFKPARAPVPTKAARAEAKQAAATAEQAADQEKAEKSNEVQKKIDAKVGKIKNIKTFLKALRLRSEVKKINKATKMLRTTSMKLFHDISPECVSGVVKSLTETEIVYACRISHDGQYSCCTQNLNNCVGLRGSLCKHLLVLIIALVQEGELDPITIDQWVAKSATAKSMLDKESMSDILLKYRGAEAGNVDWRPTETIPEDYYAL